MEVTLEFFWKNFKKIVLSPYKQGNVRLTRHMRWQNRRMCTHLLLQELQNYNLLLNSHRQESVGSHQKKITHIQGQRRSPGKMVGGAEACLEWDPIPARDTLRAQTCLVHQDPEAYTRIYPGEQTLGGCKQNLVHQDPGERSSDPTRDWPRLARECPGVSSRGVGRCWPASGLGALSVEMPAWNPLKEVPIVFITSTIVWPQVNNRRETQAHPSTETWIKDLLSMAPPISNWKTQFPPQSVSPIRKPP